jgi:hypothetical protein
MMVEAGLFQIKGMELSRVMPGECAVGYIRIVAEAYEVFGPTTRE